MISGFNGSPKSFRFKNAMSLWMNIAGNCRKNYQNQAYDHPYSRARQWRNSMESLSHLCVNQGI